MKASTMLLCKILNRSAIWRDAMQWRAHREVISLLTRPLLALELAPHSAEECLLAVNGRVPPASIGEVAATLHARCGRGKTTLEEAITLMRQTMERHVNSTPQR